MALESATYVNQLNSAFPASTDLLAQGDDHIRLIKSVLQATFPNITGAVTATQGDLNDLIALIGSGGGLVPTGAITAWYGSSASVPTGWHVCDGTLAVPRSDGSGTIDVPDLRNLVIMGAGVVAAQGTAFGAANQTATSAASGAHAHATTAGGGGHVHSGVTVAGHALTLPEIPAHKHINGVNDGNSTAFNYGGVGATGSASGRVDTTSGSLSTNGYTSTDGGGAAHTHDMSWPVTPDGTHTHATDTAATHTHGVTVAVYQPALALHYIMKV
jgi:hypothetical protein